MVMSHAARQLPAWLIFDVGQKMKRWPFIVLILALAGCASAVAAFEGWSVRDTPERKIIVQVGHVWSDRKQEALYYAALVAAQRGYRYFTIQEEDGLGASGTRFLWRKNEFLLTDVYQPDFVFDFSPGTSFTFLPAAARREKIFDGQELISSIRRWRKENFP